MKFSKYNNPNKRKRRVRRNEPYFPPVAKIFGITPMEIYLEREVQKNEKGN